MKLIINADDFGMAPSVNKAVLNLCGNASISSTSVMMNMPFVEEVKYLLYYSKISIGLHINFTQGKPVSEASKIYTLVDKDGNFFAKSVLLKRIKQNKVQYDHIKTELFAQYDKLRQIVGDRLTHFDSHQGSTRIPVVYEALLELTKEKDINSAIRVHSKYYLLGSFDKPIVCEPNIVNVHKFGIKRVIAGYYYRKKRDNWRKTFRTPDGMLFNLNNNALSILSDLTRLKTKINNNGIYEISCHPAVNANGLTETVMTDVRIKEYNLLNLMSCKENTKNFDLVSYHYLYP